jgi:radical S-adenosyl methionine domain-containing protein 2
LAKELGLTTALVSNGARLAGGLAPQLAPHLDWLALSVDSVSADVNRAHGRALGGSRVVDGSTLVAIGDLFRRAQVRLKINTVVTRLNINETLLPLIAQISPERWKIMRVLEIEGENTEYYNELSVTEDEFRAYVLRSSPSSLNGTAFIVENNNDMTDSYVMVDPLGRFISNTDGSYRTSQPILQVGIASALSDVSYDRAKFEARGGLYDW